MPKLDNIDHLVLTVSDIPTTKRFYCDMLGMKAESFKPSDGTRRWALLFGQQKINLHEIGSVFKPNAAKAVSGSADLCFITSTLLNEWQDWLSDHGVPIELGPVERTGATTKLLSLYIRDPDGNLIEISNHLPKSD